MGLMYNAWEAAWIADDSKGKPSRLGSGGIL
jgi:hypothetical protein